MNIIPDLVLLKLHFHGEKFKIQVAGFLAVRWFVQKSDSSFE